MDDYDELLLERDLDAEELWSREYDTDKLQGREYYDNDFLVEREAFDDLD